jgi:flagellar motor component MotA
MSQNALNFAIEHAFQVLAAQSWDLFDAWYEFMHEIRMEGEYEITKEIEDRFNATNLDLMLQGVMPPAQA